MNHGSRWFRMLLPHAQTSAGGPGRQGCGKGIVGYFGWNRREIEFTQCRLFREVSRSPSKTWPR